MDEDKPILKANSPTSSQSETDKSLNAEIVRAKLVYLFFYGANASLSAYLPVYYQQINMDDVQTGILASIRPFVSFVSAPLWGGIADRTGRHKIILLAAVVLYTILMAAIYPFSLMDNDQANQGNISSNSTDINITKTDIIATGNFSTMMEKVQSILHDASNASTPTHSSLSQSSIFNNELKFSLLFILLTFAFFFMAPLSPIMDATVVNLSSSIDYGKLRLWGAIGYGLFGLLSGVLASGRKLSGEVDEKADFLPPFVLFVALNALVFIVCLNMKILEDRQPSMIVLPHINVLLRNYLFMLFMVVVLIIGISSGVITWFLFLFLKDLGGSQTLLGISIAFCCFSEVIVFLFADKIIDYLGNANILLVSLAAFVTRLIGYSYLYNPWLVLPIEILHGFTYAAMWSSCVSYASSISPPEVVTTVIGLLTGVYYGLGWGLGGALGGVVYKYYGPRVLFRGCAVMCGIGMVLQLHAVFVLKRLRH